MTQGCLSKLQDCKTFDSPRPTGGVYWPLGIQFKLNNSPLNKDKCSQLRQKGWHQAVAIWKGVTAGQRRCGSKELVWFEELKKSLCELRWSAQEGEVSTGRERQRDTLLGVLLTGEAFGLYTKYPWMH